MIIMVGVVIGCVRLKVGVAGVTVGDTSITKLLIYHHQSYADIKVLPQYIQKQSHQLTYHKPKT